MKICVTVGLDGRCHVDGLRVILSLEVERCAVIPEACLREDGIYSLPAVVSDFAHDVCCDVDLNSVKLRALKE